MRRAIPREPGYSKRFEGCLKAQFYLQFVIQKCLIFGIPFLFVQKDLSYDDNSQNFSS